MRQNSRPPAAMVISEWAAPLIDWTTPCSRLRFGSVSAVSAPTAVGVAEKLFSTTRRCFRSRTSGTRASSPSTMIVPVRPRLTSSSTLPWIWVWYQ